MLDEKSAKKQRPYNKRTNEQGHQLVDSMANIASSNDLLLSNLQELMYKYNSK